MKKEDEYFSKILKSIDLNIEPPKDLKQKIYLSLPINSTDKNINNSFLMSLLLEKSLKFIIPLSILISIILNICTPIAAV